MTSNQRVAVVTGSSSGNGYKTSLTLARKGFLTYATLRSLAKGENIKSVAEKEKLPLRIVQLDVTEDESVKKAMQSIISEASGVDVLINNAGYALFGAFEDLTIEKIKAQYETNLFGVIRVTQAPQHHYAYPLKRRREFYYLCRTSPAFTGNCEFGRI
jgi:NAD(P)-dependent dehydrogenase (short-subunit alcohol dehydrogenase family)